MQTINLEVSDKTAKLFGGVKNISEQTFIQKRFGIELNDKEVLFPVEMEAQDFLNTLESEVLNTKD